MKKFLKLLSIISVLAIIVVFATSCSGAASSQTLQDTQVSTVTRGTLRKDITPSGNLAMPNSANLTFTFGRGGTVQQVLVQIGDSVKKGQPLAKLDDIALQEALIQAQIDAKTAQMNYERALNPTLSTSGVILQAPDPLDIDVKKLTLNLTTMKLTEAQNNLDHATIIAPFDGLVATVNIIAGDLVGANQVVMREIDPTLLEVNAIVNEMDIFSVKIGSQATISIDALPNVTFPATVKAISPSATIQSGVVNYAVKLSVTAPELTRSNRQGQPSSTTGQPPVTGPDTAAPPSATPVSTSLPAATSGQISRPAAAATNPQTSAIPALKEGLTITVNILIDEKANTLMVPNRAIIRQGRNIVVRVVKNGTTTEDRPVTLGINNWQFTEVTSGLSEGEQIVLPSASTTTTTPGGGTMRLPNIRG